MQQPPAEPGMTVDRIDTPALVVELDPFERNLARMAELARDAGVRQIALGAVGVCCQKVSEAQALVDGGVRDVLVSNEVVGERKIARLAALAARARAAVCADDAGNVTALGAAAAREGAELGVLVEIDVGAARCGVAPGAAAEPTTAGPLGLVTSTTSNPSTSSATYA